jgi:hypothetical protein
VRAPANALRFSAVDFEACAVPAFADPARKPRRFTTGIEFLAVKSLFRLFSVNFSTGVLAAAVDARRPRCRRRVLAIEHCGRSVAMWCGPDFDKPDDRNMR